MTQTFETDNSRYIFDTDDNTYVREPIVTQHVDSHRLVYGERLPYVSFEVVPRAGGIKVLHIMAPDSTLGIFTSPIVRES